MAHLRTQRFSLYHRLRHDEVDVALQKHEFDNQETELILTALSMNENDLGDEQDEDHELDYEGRHGHHTLSHGTKKITAEGSGLGGMIGQACLSLFMAAIRYNTEMEFLDPAAARTRVGKAKSAKDAASRWHPYVEEQWIGAMVHPLLQFGAQHLPSTGHLNGLHKF